MLADDLRPGQGLAFNTNKRSDSYPDLKGQIKTPSGEVLDIALWFKTTKNIDTNYLSIKLTSLTNDEQQPDPNYIPDNEGDEG